MAAQAQPPYWHLISVLFSSLPLTPALAMTLHQAAYDLYQRGAGTTPVAGDMLQGRVTNLRKDMLLGTIAGPAFEARIETERGKGTVRFLLTRQGLELMEALRGRAVARVEVTLSEPPPADAFTSLPGTREQERHGSTVVLTHDTNSPRPYSRDILVQGTRGIVQKYPEEKIYLEGRGKPHAWQPLESYRAEYRHPVWVELEAQTKGAGHGGMDFIEDYRLINALLRGAEPDMDVYDAAVLSAVSELSARSIERNGEPMKFPDFTRGMWKTPRALHVNEKGI